MRLLAASCIVRQGEDLFAFEVGEPLVVGTRECLAHDLLHQRQVAFFVESSKCIVVVTAVDELNVDRHMPFTAQ